MAQQNNPDPLARFGRGSPAQRIAFLRGVVAALQRLDPGLRECQGLWLAGKTVRFANEVIGVTQDDQILALSTEAVHLSVENADLGLLRLLFKRLESGDLDFHLGRVEPPGGARDAWMASLGMGSLAVFVERGELMIVVNGSRVVPVPEDMMPGAPGPVPLPPGEGFVMTIFEGQPYAIASFPGVRREEARALKKAKVRVGLARHSDTLLVLGVNVPGLTQGWADMPFALGIEAPERRRLNPPEANGASVLMLALIDRLTGQTVALRGLRMSAAWTRTLHDLLERQQDAAAGYDRAAYAAEVEASYRRWPTPNHMAKDFLAVEIGRDR